MAEFKLDEIQCAHIFSALGVAGNEWKKVKKSLAKLNKDDPSIDAEIALNAHLSLIFNPHAEDEAREKERRRDPSQMDLTEVASSGETGGGNKAGQIVKLQLSGEEKAPTDEDLRDALTLLDRYILLSDIKVWPSSERDAVIRWVNERIDTDPATDVPEPEHLAIIALSERRLQELYRAGPYMIEEVQAEGAKPEADPISFNVYAATDDEAKVNVIELVDGTDAEITAARLNREAIKHADMPTEHVQGWLDAGPWKAIGKGGPLAITDSAEANAAAQEEKTRWYVVNDAQGVEERALSQSDARFTAAKFNRTIAGRQADGSWHDAPAPITPAE